MEAKTKEMVERYTQQGHSLSDIAKDHKMNPQSVRAHLIENGVDIRPRGRKPGAMNKASKLKSGSADGVKSDSSGLVKPASQEVRLAGTSIEKYIAHARRHGCDGIYEALRDDFNNELIKLAKTLREIDPKWKVPT